MATKMVREQILEKPADALAYILWPNIQQKLLSHCPEINIFLHLTLKFKQAEKNDWRTFLFLEKKGDALAYVFWVINLVQITLCYTVSQISVYLYFI